MPPLTDAEIRQQILATLELEAQGVSGYVIWRAQARDELFEEEGATQMLANEELYEFVRSGGRINELPEKRPEFDSGMLYEFRFRIFGKEAYVESRLEEYPDKELYLWVVSFHWGWRK